ncbi:MAG: hypothetical protein RBU30_03040 [Polyangia bacterium]|jgi:hypothetical protein|nr:hypothetical protein [Polyangia bacterium]
MGTLRFDLEMELPRPTAFDLLDQHFRGLGYRVEESDRMSFRLVMDRGWIVCALLGGPVRRRHVWLRATLQEISKAKCSIWIIFDGYNKAVDVKAAALYLQEIEGFKEACQRHQAEAAESSGTAPPAVIREVVIKEVVRIPCKYCGNLVENTAKKCSDCGAPLA